MTMKRVQTPNTAENLPRLSERFGLLIGSSELSKLLGYPNQNAFRTAVFRGTMPIRMFKLKGRRGRFSLTTDVENWLATLTTNAGDELENGNSRKTTTHSNNGNPMEYETRGS